MINTYGIQHKTDTAANWASNDPTLLAGELGYESDTGKFKIGDGSTAWSALSYFQTASGADGLGLTWNFDTTTSSTPTSGDIRFNNATPASVTEVYIHETGAVTLYGREMLSGLKNGDALFIQVVGDTSKYIYFDITSLTDNGGDWTIAVANVLASGSLPANNDVLSVVPVYLATGGLSDLVDDTTPQLGGNLDMNGNNIQGVTPTEMGYVSGVTSAIQTQLNGKLANVVEDTTPQLGGNLDMNGNNIEGVTPTEMGYVSGVTSAIQTQIDGKAASSHTHAAGDVTSGTFADARIAQSNVTQHQAAIDHGSIAGLADDDHTQYALLNGRVAGQVLYGSTAASGTLILDSTSDSTKGILWIGGNNCPINFNSNAVSAVGKIQIQTEAYTDGEVDDGNSSTADTIDWTTGNFHKSAMTGNCTYTFTAPSGPTTLILKLVQDATGSRTATWPATVKWPGGTPPTLSTAASAVDIVTFYYDGTNYWGTSVLNLS